MQFNLDLDMESFTILSYTSDSVTIKHPLSKQREAMNSSFIISPKKLIKDWAPQAIQHLKKENLHDLLHLSPEVVLIGTGASLKFPETALISCFWEANIGVEIMDTAAVCRTYNILVNEGRLTVAGIIID